MGDFTFNYFGRIIALVDMYREVPCCDEEKDSLF